MSFAIDLGLAGDAPATIDLVELLATRLLVQGNSGSGKSHLLRRLLEQSAGLVQQVVIDPEGDFATLADAHGHVVIEPTRDDPQFADSELGRIAARVREHRVSVVLSLAELQADEQMRAAAAFLNGLFEAEREHWYPVLVVVDEAQLFAPAASGDAAEEARRLSLAAMTNLMCRGRKRGLAGVIATQRLAKLAKNVAAEASNFLMGRTFLDIDMARAADLLGLERRQAEAFRDLARGHFVALGPAVSRRPLTIAVGPTATRSRAVPLALTPPPAPSHALGGLILAGPAVEGRPAPRPKPRLSAPDVIVQLANYRPPEPADEPAEAAIDPAEREAAVATILAAVLADADAAMATAATLYGDFAMRCRARRLGEPMALGEFKRRLAVARAEAGESGAAPEGPVWDRAQALAALLPEDLAGLFLTVARAAIAGAPTPGDAALAGAYGTSSGARARRALAFLEERGVLVVRRDLRGAPIIVLPDLELETAPGEPSLAAPPRRARG